MALKTKYFKNDVFPNFWVALCDNEAEARDYAKKYGVALEETKAQGWMAQLSGSHYLVYIKKIDKLKHIWWAIDTAVHEATHIRQYYFRYIGENDRTSEFEAYFAGGVSSWMVKEMMSMWEIGLHQKAG